MKTANNSKPFLGKSFYLDLKKYPNSKILKDNLIKFGAKVDDFFSKDVSYVVTDRSPKTTTTKDFWMSPKSPAFDYKMFGSLDSPCTSSPSNDLPKKHVLTRGQMLVNRASKHHYAGTTDILEVCQQWKVPVLQVGKVEKWLKKCKLLMKNKVAVTSVSKSGNVVKNRVTNLNHPFIKIEDVNQRFKPVFMQKEQWTDSLFLNPSKLKVNEQVINLSKSPDSAERHECNFKKRSINKKLKKYCEICYCYFDNLNQHLSVDSHKKYVTDPKNYELLQQVLTSFPTIGEFLNKHNSNSCSVSITIPIKNSSDDGLSCHITASCTPSKMQTHDEVHLNRNEDHMETTEGNECLEDRNISIDYIEASCLTPLQSEEFPFLKDHSANSSYQFNLKPCNVKNDFVCTWAVPLLDKNACAENAFEKEKDTKSDLNKNKFDPLQEYRELKRDIFMLKQAAGCDSVSSDDDVRERQTASHKSLENISKFGPSAACKESPEKCNIYCCSLSHCTLSPISGNDYNCNFYESDTDVSNDWNDLHTSINKLQEDLDCQDSLLNEVLDLSFKE